MMKHVYNESVKFAEIYVADFAIKTLSNLTEMTVGDWRGGYGVMCLSSFVTQKIT